MIHPRKVIQTMYDGNLLLNITAHISTDALVMILTKASVIKSVPILPILHFKSVPILLQRTI